MSNTLWMLLVIAGVILGILLIEPLRKIVVWITVIGLAFALGWWSRPMPAVSVTSAHSPPPCTSTF